MSEQRRFCLILDRLRSAHNTGNIFRIAEAVGASEIIACGYTPAPPHPKLEKTAMGTDKLVPCRVFSSAAEAVVQLRKEGYQMILAAEPGSDEDFAWKKSYRFPLAVIMGNEALGVSYEALELCDGKVSLPMAGSKASINVGNAAAAIAYAIVSVTGGTFDKGDSLPL
ncbi:MAG: hypothetical protein J6S24_01220 [Lentisphaeria bacterium]|nr:hypothetical protein [Lentisphaeria bacterium]MBO5900612.1 hypothetical protein [Lentisphaeria bacterium]